MYDCVHIVILMCIRCGMVYVDPGELRWKPYVQTWIEHNFPAKISDNTKVHVHTYICTYIIIYNIMIIFHQKYILNLFDNFIDPGLKFIKKNCIQTIDQVRSTVHVYIHNINEV